PAIHARWDHDGRQQHDEHGVLEMMTSNRRRKLAGQAILIMTLSIVVLTGLLAIAVDGGMIYLDKRRLQNASDSGALAGGDATETLPLRSYTSIHQTAL